MEINLIIVYARLITPKKNKNNSTCINTRTNSTSGDDESAPLYAINLEICATLSSESFSESDNDDICNNHSTVTEINDDICNNHSTVTEMNIKEIEDVLDNIHLYTQYTDDSESESDKPCIGKKKSSLKIRMLEPGNGDVVPKKQNRTFLEYHKTEETH